MLLYSDLISGDEMLSDSFNLNETDEGIFYEVPGKWVVKGAVDVDIGANPSAEGGEEGEGVDDGAVKVVDVVDTFRLQEMPPFDKKSFLGWVKAYIQKLAPMLPADRQDKFKADVQPAVKKLLSKLADLQFFAGESCNVDAGMAFAFYAEGATDPTFIYFKDGLKEVKC